MPLLRLLFLLLCLAGGGWHLEQERRAGRLRLVEELFLDFLVANARERLTTPVPGADPGVVFVKLRAEDRAEYQSWPPPPLDWVTLLKALAAYEPDVLVVPTPLAWSGPAPDFLPALADALLAFPSVVLGMETQWADSSEAEPFLGGLDDSLPKLRHSSEDASAAPALRAVVTAPAEALRAQAELGMLAAGRLEEGSWSLAYTLRTGDSLRPALTAQALARRTRTPYALHRVRLGPGAGAFLEQGRFVPLNAGGTMTVRADQPLREVDALSLMTGTLADTLTQEEKSALGRGKVVVLGLDGEGAPPDARLHAQALAQMLSLPVLRVLSQREQWAVWAFAALAALWLALRIPRSRALRTGLGLMFAALLAGFLVFQSALVWCPPTMPFFALAAGTLTARLFGRGDLPPPSAGERAPAAEVPDAEKTAAPSSTEPPAG